MSNINLGNAFPLEKLGSDISRNNYNYQAILNGLIEWNTTANDNVRIRLTKDSDPWYEDYIIPSKKTALSINAPSTHVTGSINPNTIALSNKIPLVLSGGYRKFKTNYFDASQYGTPDTDIVIDVNEVKLNVGDRVILIPSNTLPSPLSIQSVYYVVYSNGDTIRISDSYNGATLTLTGGSGNVEVVLLEEQPELDNEDPGDIVTVKASVGDSGNSDWELCYSVMIQEYNATAQYVFGNIVRNNSNVLKRVIYDCVGTELNYSSRSRSFIQEWTSNATYLLNELVSYNNNLYIVTKFIGNSYTNPASDINNFSLYLSGWSSSVYYTTGNAVYYNGSIYVATKAVTSASPVSDTVSWNENIIAPVLDIGKFNKSSLFRWYVNRDASSVYLKNVSENASSTSTDISLELNVKIKEPSSIYQRSVGLFNTSNYSMWPINESSIWNGSVGNTDTNIPINKRQNYSAVMMFDHTKLDKTKTVNFINYDGPDRDQGLCIYLPVEIDLGDTGLAYPEDGFTFEFFFRIWPNPVLTGDITRDHVVNKAQIYVYTALNRDSIIDDSCEMPIAKFSMARTTNFYMFGENVSVPDKPVCYRATFTYSHSEKRWVTMDYYQLPDHLFVGPVGFIDPQNPSNLDINALVNNNPNPAFVGYETAGFPLFQDPFSNADLTPYRLTTESDLDKFYNRTT